MTALSLALSLGLPALAAAAILLAAALGAAWRLWLGQHGPRSLKLPVGWLLATAVLLACGLTPALAMGVAFFVVVGWTFGHVFDPWWPLIPRYGLATAAVGILLWAFGHAWGLAYAPAGMLAPIGYVAARRAGLSCWTCAGEAWLGAIVFGGLPLAAAFG